MKKNEFISWEWEVPRLQKVLRIMKLTVSLVLLSVISVFASKSYAQTKVLTLDMKNSTVKEVLRSIEKQSEFVFMYSEKLIDVNREVSVTVKNKKINEVLDELFAGTDVSYKVRDRFVLLTTPEVTGSDLLAQQQKSVSGKVTDSGGQPLPGATVVVKGTTQGTVTNADGEYSLSNIPEDATLVFSFVGMRTQEIPVGNQTSINVTMEEETIGLEEVVAVGYGTQKKVNLTGSVANIDYESISSRPITNSINALSGTLPGLSIIQGGGQPGKENNSIMIRGIGSINASSTPLIIIDGVTTDIDVFSNLNPNDIKEISILKDAASSAIYGSRAANGVILVNTKKGSYDKFQVNLNSYWGLQQATVLPDMLDSWDAAVLENEARVNSGLPIFFTNEQIELMKNDDPGDGFHNTDWINEVFRTSPMQNYNVSVSTGSNKIRVYTSFNYYDQNGIIINTNSEKYSLRSNLDFQPNENIKFGIIFSAIKKKNHESQTPIGGSDRSITGTVYGTPRAAPIYYNNGNYFSYFNNVPGYQGLYNPVMIAKTGYNDNTGNNLLSAFTGELNWKGFKFNTLISYNVSSGLTKLWSPLNTITNDAGIVVFQDTPYAELTQTFSNTNVLQVENYLNYTNNFGKDHFLSILGGHTFLESKYSWFRGYGRNFPSNFLQILSASASDSQRAYGENSNYALQSVFGRINYNYKEKYLFESNIRYDGSSRFAKNNRYGLFPSFSLGWRISEENFLKEVSFINNLKLRTSWGILGNQDIGDNYAYAPAYSTTTNYLLNGQFVSGASIIDLANENIEWETTETLDFGMDLDFIYKSGLIGVTFDYFIKNTQNMLIQLPIPITLGNLSPPFQNIGEIQNKGWELSGNYRNKYQKIQYRLDFNVSHVKNEAINLNGQEWYPSNQIIKEGVPLYSWYGYSWDGIFQNEQEIETSAKQTPAAVPGDIKFKDLSGSAGEPDNVINSFDRTIIGNSIPEFYYGFGGNISYENFDLNVFFQGVANVDVNTLSRINHAAPFGGNPESWSVDWLDRWTPEKPSKEYPRVDYNRQINNTFSDFYLEDGSYLRLKNIEIGYYLPKNISSKMGINNTRVYIGGQNLLTFTKVKHFDPERARNQVRTEFYPQLKIYQLGINLTF